MRWVSPAARKSRSSSAGSSDVSPSAMPMSSPARSGVKLASARLRAASRTRSLIRSAAPPGGARPSMMGFRSTTGGCRPSESLHRASPTDARTRNRSPTANRPSAPPRGVTDPADLGEPVGPEGPGDTAGPQGPGDAADPQGPGRAAGSEGRTGLAVGVPPDG